MQSTRVSDIPGLQYCWKVGGYYLAGQPAEESFESLKALGIKRIFNLRNAGEGDFSFEEEKCKELGMEYFHLPIVIDGQLSRENCLKLSQLVGQGSDNFIHCASANRVGAWFITYLTLFKDMDFEEAVDIAMASGLTNPALVAHAEAVVESSR